MADRDVDMLGLVKEYLPPLSIENVKKFADILKKETGCVQKDPYFNAVLRKFHRVRYQNWGYKFVTIIRDKVCFLPGLTG